MFNKIIPFTFYISNRDTFVLIILQIINLYSGFSFINIFTHYPEGINCLLYNTVRNIFLTSQPVKKCIIESIVFTIHLIFLSNIKKLIFYSYLKI